MRRTRWHFAAALALSAIVCAPHAGHAAHDSGPDSWESRVRRSSEAVERARADGARSALAEALARRAEAYQVLGHRREALADLQEASELVAKEDETSRLRVAVMGALGQAYFLAGNTERAEAMLIEALARARRLGASSLVAAVMNDQGMVLRATGKPAEALSAHLASASTARVAGDALLAAKASLNAARLQLQRGDPALSRVQDALSDLGGVPDSREKTVELAAAGELLRRISRAPADPAIAELAASTLAQALAGAQRTGDARGSSMARGYLAAVALDRDAVDEALRLNDLALFDAQRAGAPDIVFRWQWRRAQMLERAGRESEALAAYRRALESLDLVKADLAAELLPARESFRDQVSPAYLGLANLLMRRASGLSDRGEKNRTLREAQSVLERFKAVELEDYFQDDCVARYLARSRPVEQIAANTAVIYPVPLPDRLEILVSVGPDIHQFVVPVASDTLAREALALRGLLEKRATYRFLPHAQRLYDWIIRPLEALLAAHRVDTLVVIPDDPLRGIPVSALHDGRDYLLARYTIATAPGLTLVEPRPLSQAPQPILAAGLTEGVQGFNALPHVETELELLMKTAGAGAQLRNQSFTTTNFDRELTSRSYSIVHVASHARFEADSRRSFLLTYDGRLTMDQLEKHLKPNRFRDESIELLFLSACETAAGDERAALGLAGVAVKAGARSALATLWQINDHATSLLVGEFYRQLLQPGTNKAQALRRAQLAMITDLRYRHPGYWSPFILIGNWL